MLDRMYLRFDLYVVSCMMEKKEVMEEGSGHL